MAYKDTQGRWVFFEKYAQTRFVKDSGNADAQFPWIMPEVFCEQCRTPVAFYLGRRYYERALWVEFDLDSEIPRMFVVVDGIGIEVEKTYPNVGYGTCRTWVEVKQ